MSYFDFSNRIARLSFAQFMRLTTSTFDIMKSDPTLGRAEALRRVMLAYMNDATDPLSAYPALWAPFVVVGEGAREVSGPGDRVLPQSPMSARWQACLRGLFRATSRHMHCIK
jgi:hypothetical protein